MNEDNCLKESYKALYEDVSRQRKAIDKKYQPLTLNRDNKTATFRGSNGETYITTLHKCSCADFHIMKAPCKHMFRLAHELGMYDLNKNTPVPNIEQQDAIDEAEYLLHELKKYWEFMPQETVIKYCKRLIELKDDTGTIVESDNKMHFDIVEGQQQEDTSIKNSITITKDMIFKLLLKEREKSNGNC